MTRSYSVNPDTNVNPDLNGYSNALQEIKNGIPSAIEIENNGAVQLDILTKDGRKQTDVTQSPNDEYDEDDDDNDAWIESEDENDDDSSTCSGGQILASVVQAIQRTLRMGIDKFHEITRGYFWTTIFLVGYLVYFVIAMNYRFDDESAHRLLGCTILGLVIFSRHAVCKVAKTAWRKIVGPRKASVKTKKTISIIRLVIKWLLYVALAGVAAWSIIDEGKENPQNLRSLPGLCCFLVICLLFSTHPRKINWHTVYWSLGLQFLFALFALRWQKGKDSIMWVQDRLDEFFANSKAGSELLFGEKYAEHYLIFGAFPTFIFTNATIYMLYYVGAMQFLVRCIGNFLKFTLDTSPVESMSVAASIFLEGIASVAAVGPYMSTTTKSQLFLVMTSVFASVGGAYLALLSSISIPLESLIAAMVISAPATFTVCKLMVPESKKVQQYNDIDLGDEEKKKYTNITDAGQAGAIAMLTVIGHAAVNAFAIWSFIAWINSTLTWFGDRVGIHNLSIELISSYLFYPASLAMGIEPEDCRNVAMLLGYRITSSNLVAFIKMVEMKGNRYNYYNYMEQTNFTGPVSHVRDDIILDNWNMTLKDGYISERSEAITTYCLTGFSSFPAAAVLLGILYTFLPNRRRWIAKTTLPALLAGNIANCMTGCFASLFY